MPHTHATQAPVILAHFRAEVLNTLDAMKSAIAHPSAAFQVREQALRQHCMKQQTPEALWDDLNRELWEKSTDWFYFTDTRPLLKAVQYLLQAYPYFSLQKDRLERALADVSAQNGTLKNTSMKLAESLKTSQASNQDLHRKLADLQKNYNDLAEQLHSLNAMLSKTPYELHQQLEENKIYIGTLENQIAKLKNRNLELEDENKKLSKTLEEILESKKQDKITQAAYQADVIQRFAHQNEINVLLTTFITSTDANDLGTLRTQLLTLLNDAATVSANTVPASAVPTPVTVPSPTRVKSTLFQPSALPTSSFASNGFEMADRIAGNVVEAAEDIEEMPSEIKKHFAYCKTSSI